MATLILLLCLSVHFNFYAKADEAESEESIHQFSEGCVKKAIPEIIKESISYLPSFEEDIKRDELSLLLRERRSTEQFFYNITDGKMKFDINLDGPEYNLSGYESPLTDQFIDNLINATQPTIYKLPPVSKNNTLNSNLKVTGVAVLGFPIVNRTGKSKIIPKNGDINVITRITLSSLPISYHWTVGDVKKILKGIAKVMINEAELILQMALKKEIGEKPEIEEIKVRKIRSTDLFGDVFRSLIENMAQFYKPLIVETVENYGKQIMIRSVNFMEENC